MKLIFTIIYLCIALSLTGLILLQSSQGGLSSELAGNSFYRSKRGAERLIFIATIVTSVLYLATAIINLIIQ